ncbi:MarR family winged helix-turn-helix transcriptional regulator [Nocardia spumae]|uniref:MarR family winged helix-turn-helix transcriptional regulator n=1 Tax=Nocardia spumae TaxID=2887190 RepID=UPI001D140CE0|nr:MarR family transcriptional regulator [Nocardia spumae]
MSTLLDQRLAPYGVTAQQAAVLVSVAAGRTAPRVLATALRTDTAGLTRLLDRLEAKELVTRRRSTTDRRSVVVELTDAGRTLTPDLLPRFTEAAHHMFAGVPERAVRLVGDVLARAVANLRGEDGR